MAKVTGGVTEAVKRRVVLPMSGSLADTNHVLGHELVHAFQFDLTGDDPRDRTGLMPGILAFPLWYAEGMAEYLSLGPVDTQTAMWLRDAALHERLPNLRDLDDPDYFPYRWGHAFWAYIGAKYGDRAVASLIRSSANPRTDLEGLARQLGTDPDTLTAEWHAAILAKARELADEFSPVMSMPRRVLDRDTGGGRYNVGPRVSPDGRTVAFFSEKDRFSVDLFLADADTGRVIRRLTTSSNDPHFDSLQFLNSAGAWSPDGQTLAITATRAGRPVLAMIQASSGKIRREIKLRDLDDAMHPAFAPDGMSIVVSGNRGGVIDLYRVDLASSQLDRLTTDVYADLEAVFTPDSRGLVFVTERFSTDLERLEPGPLRLAYLDLETRRVRPIPGFLSGNHLSPQVTPDGLDVVFVADPDGVNNLYRMPLDGGPAERLSSVATGIAGITATSPALSMAADGRLVFSVFEDDGHAIYRLDPEDTMVLVPPPATDEAALLPGRAVPGGDVHDLLVEFRPGAAARGAPDSRRTLSPQTGARLSGTADDFRRRQFARTRASWAGCRPSSATCWAIARWARRHRLEERSRILAGSCSTSAGNIAGTGRRRSRPCRPASVTSAGTTMPPLAKRGSAPSSNGRTCEARFCRRFTRSTRACGSRCRRAERRCRSVGRRGRPSTREVADAT